MDEDLRKLAARVGDPWTPANPYFAAAEPHMEHGWRTLVWPFIQDCNFDAVIDLACGHGRNSAFLAPLSGRLLLLDIQAGNIDICRHRFVQALNVQCAVNNGFDLRPAESDAFTLVYCFDAMVHFDSDVIRSYLRDMRRVLRVGGRAFLHHSNLSTDLPWDRAPHSRNFMTKELFAHYARKEGLGVVRQRVIPWVQHPDIDCLSLLQKNR